MFRAELYVEPHYLSTEFYLDVELMFCDLSSLGGPTGWKNNYKKYEAHANFKPVQTQTYKLLRLATGICEFVPVNFQGHFYSVLNLQVQSVMLDLRFRQNQWPGEERTNSIADFFFGDGRGNLPNSLESSQVMLMYGDYRRVLTNI